ncbi:hypothetical protein [Streptomyces sp. NPDC012510]|uniref:hypothetical protein n=1 Tax=Streptomyces sp. NPDC012510 TaxID=3364838 RepID=UPI0036EA8329
MAAGGFCKLPDGNVVVALNLPRTTAGATAGALPTPGSGGVFATLPRAATRAPQGAPPGGATVGGTGPAGAGLVGGAAGAAGAGGVPGDGSVRVLVLAANRARALTRLRNLGMRAIYLRGNAAPPTPDEITAVLHHPDGLIWRPSPTTPPSTTPELWHPIRALLRRPTVRV